MDPKAFGKFDLTGKTALVTGGGTGIGYFMSRALARGGARVMISARREDVLQAAVTRLKAESNNEHVEYHTVDLNDRRSIASLISHANKTLGSVDVLIGNAGVNFSESLTKITDEALDKTYQVNIAANVALLRAFAPGMQSKRWGRAIFTSSVGALRGTSVDGTATYNMSKAGLDGFVRSAATELGRQGITVNSVIPGTFKTDMLRDAAEAMDRVHGAGHADKFFSEFVGMTALGRMAECEEMEGIFQFLASDAGAYVTGQSIAIDGGLSIMMRPNYLPAA